MREGADGGELSELARLFLKLGVIGFGGPAAHIALMEEEVVRRRGWLTRQEFLDLLGLVNLLPGPNSTELALIVGRRRAGTPGLLVAGACFIAPATLLVLGCAWAYVRFGRVPAVAGAWNGVKPIVIAVVVVALVGLARSAVREWRSYLVGAAALLLAATGTHELLVLLLAGLGSLLLARGIPAPAACLTVAPYLAESVVVPIAGLPGIGRLFLYFLEIGATIYGSGYVLLSFLRAGLVERAGWLTEAQLLDAVAVGQMTPGPVFTTATFVGYLLRGVSGALAATAGIFLPAFLLVGAGEAILARVRRSAAARAFLDGVTLGSLALMAMVTWQLGRAAIDGPVAALLALAALLLLRAGVNSAWLFAAAALAGMVMS
jgi:chromate transporter